MCGNPQKRVFVFNDCYILQKIQYQGTKDLLINTDSINLPCIIYKNSYYCTLEAKLQSFRIELNFRAIISNAHLFGFGVIKNDVRVFCKRTTETVLQLFRTRIHVLKFWEDVSSWLSHHFKCDIILNNFNKLFGFECFKSRAKIIFIGLRFIK